MGIPSSTNSVDSGAVGSLLIPRPITRILYRAVRSSAASLILCGAVSAFAQQTPEIVPLEKQVHQKKDLGPRALGLLQMTANGKATLVPVAIMINGKFYDAGAYKADPVPMALDSGTVYEGERTGKSIGLFTISGALHSENPSAVSPWLGAGSWLAAGATPPKTALKAESVPRGMEEVDEGPPRLTRPASESAPSSPSPKQPSGSAPPSSAPAGSAPSGNSPPAGSSQPSSSSPNSAPPATSSAPQTPTPASNPTPPASSAPAGSAPPAASAPESTAPKAEGAKPEGPAPAPSDSGARESGRPVLRRGKPTQPLPEDDDVPGYKRVGASAASSGSSTASKPVTTSPVGPVELVPAVSDSGGPEPHAYTFDWFNNEEERNRFKQMLALASEQLNAYVNAEASAAITAKTAGQKTPAHKSVPAREPVFENVKMRTFDLWNNNQPVLVLTAEAYFPPPKGTAPASEPTIYTMTIAARTDIYGSLNKLYAGITDKYHLDIRPRLELIDAVDADGDGRGELLFRETSDVATGYVIYRATNDSLWKMFDTLNP